MSEVIARETSQLVVRKGDVRTLDPRTRLIKQKHFGWRPKPLERYLWSLDLPQTAERVFWTHWDEGYRQYCKDGSWVTRIAQSDMAARIGKDVKSIERAYKQLKTLGLIWRRPGPRPHGSRFETPVTETEVWLPKEALNGLLAAPDRAQAADALTANAPVAAAEGTASAPAQVLAKDIWPRCLAKLTETVEPQDRKAWLEPLQADLRNGAVRLLCPNRFVLEAVQKRWMDAITEALTACNAGTPVTVSFEVGDTGVPPAGPQTAPVPPKISLFSAKRIRERVSEFVPAMTVDQVLQEILWSTVAGAHQGMPEQKAINVCLKLLREGRWRRPRRMPQGWSYELTLRGRR